MLSGQSWNPSNHFIMSEGMAAYFKAALEDGDPMLVAAARDDIARTQGITQISGEAGLGC
ncbi:helix-turn-helix domain-containing protein [Vulcanococcus limneticus]|uniref:hypothetical protein n=1 Tax=Vulcanococcus limneticus TaxID=2170428 RepID=UPI0038CDA2A8